MKRLLLVCVLAVALLAVGVSQALAVDEATYVVWKTGPYPGADYTQWHQVVGYMSLFRTGDQLRVVFISAAWENYELVETHVDAAPTLDGIPHNNGGPIPGRFDQGTEHGPGVVQYTYLLDVTGYPDPCYVAGHVVIRNTITGQEETGWATDCNTAAWEFPGANWARYVLLDGM